MNYLAHALLSGDNPALLIGNFIADHIRGNDLAVYSPDVVAGIRMHRQIDAFTDAHPLFRKSKRLFYEGFEKHSGILVDIYFDHLLARNFRLYSAKSLDDFSKEVYGVYLSGQSLFPTSSQRFLEYVVKNHIYVSYASISGIKTVLSHLSHRIGHRIQLDDSVALFTGHERELESNFTGFFSELRSEFQ